MSKQTTTPVAALENLEDRRLMSATTATLSDAGVWQITGDDVGRIYTLNKVALGTPFGTIPCLQVKEQTLGKPAEDKSFLIPASKVKSVVITGGAGNDWIEAKPGADVKVRFEGGADHDTLKGGGSGDVLFGNAGNDTIWARESATANFISGGDGNDEIRGTAGADTIFGGVGHDEIFGDPSDVPWRGLAGDLIYGGEGNDFINGGYGNDSLYGENGHDHILGDMHYANGNDLISGGAGDDFVYGGPGADTVSGDAGTDSIFKQDFEDDTITGVETWLAKLPVWSVG
jgi:Ca2+-binding RTX toxin-like protein